MAVDGHPTQDLVAAATPLMSCGRCGNGAPARPGTAARLGCKQWVILTMGFKSPRSYGFYWILLDSIGMVGLVVTGAKNMELPQQLLKPQSQGPGVNPSEPWKLLLGRKAELLLYYIIVIYSDSIIAYFCPKMLEK